MKLITIEGDPYSYLRASKKLVLYTFNNRQPTIVDIGEYIVLDRHFNTAVFTASEWEWVLKREFTKFKRKQGGADAIKNKKQIQDKG